MAHEYVKEFGLPYTLLMRHYWHSERYMKWVAAAGDNRRNPIHKKIKKICWEVVERYQNEENLPAPQSYYDNPKTVWFCWWQGEDQMPEIINACYRRMQRCVPPDLGRVQLVTKDNYSEFTTIANHVFAKLGKGVIPLDVTNILRHALLSDHGGIWLDANYFPCRTLPEEWFRQTGVFTERKEGLNNPPHFGNWSSSFLGGPPGTVATRFTKDALEYYWSKCDLKVDYTLQASVLSLAYEYLPAVKRDIDRLPKTPYEVHHNLNMPAIVNEPYEKERFEDVFYRRPIHKITHKAQYQKTTEDGRPTVYAHILELADQDPVA